MKIKVSLILFLLIQLLFLGGCSTTTTPLLTVGFIYPGSISDLGINQMQEEARLEMIEYFGGKVQTISKSSVNESNIESVIYDMVNNEASLIFISSNEFDSQIERAANIYKDTDFVIYNSNLTSDNIKSYTARQYEVDYLCGIAAGSATTNNLIGYLAPDPSNNYLIQINAFALGVLNSNPDAQIDVDFTGYPASTSRLNAAISKLIFNGCDVVASCLPDNQVLIDAANNGLKVIGMSPSGISNESTYITSVKLNLADFYIDEVESVIDGEFDNTHYIGTVYDNFVSIDDLSYNVSEKTRENIASTFEAIKKGNLAIFTGPFYDSDNNLRANDGQVLSEVDLANMDYLLSNVRVLN